MPSQYYIIIVRRYDMFVVKFLLFVWQIIQNVVALFLILISKRKVHLKYGVDGKDVTVWFVDTVFGCGVSLGDFVLLDYSEYYQYAHSDWIMTTVRHEHGHQIQSRIFGPLYLIVIGFFSAICNNLWDRIFHRSWPLERRHRWYYGRYPERWADILGKVPYRW